MFIINIIINTQEHGYFYEHGAELLGAIITALAFVYTFRRIYKENKKEKENEKEKNQKTLKMIDLISGKHIENIEYIKEKLNNVQYGITFKIGIDEKEPVYQIDLQNIDSNNNMHNKKIYHTRSFDKYCVLESFKIIKENNTKQVIENYKDEITKILSNQHLNMDLKSLAKINDKINTLSVLIEKLKMLDQFINLIEFSADKEMNDPRIISSKKTKEEEEKPEKFLKDRVTTKIKELEIILNYLEKAQQKLE
ncbi:hypothetical protein [Staphylococcus shinii]|uniref:hypothetical protein n=1 Tax=Staphylococcus shinii TaxID=2912228 RepID=UPI003CE6A71B